MPIETYNPNAVNGIVALPQSNVTTAFNASSTTPQEKLNNLNNKVQDKLELLLQNPNLKATTDDKNQYDFSQRPDMVNYKTPEELQYEFGKAASHQVLTRDDGSKYMFRRNADDTYAHDSKGNWIEDTYTGPMRNAYVDNTAEGNMKFGLASSSVKPGYTPFEARYMDKTHENPYNYNKSYTEDGKIVYNADGTQKVGYDGTPGPRGVTNKNGALMDITLPHNIATELEYDIHTNAGQLASRAMGQGPKTESTTAQFGAGQTEYTTPDAPLWNVNYDMKNAKIAPNTILPHEVTLSGSKGNNTQNGIPKSREDAYTEYLKLVNQSEGRSWGDALKDTGLQIVSGSLNATKNLGDIYGLATGDMDNKVSRISDAASKWYQEKYSDALKNANQHKQEEVVKQTTELGKFMTGVKENINNPMMLAQLVTESAPMMVVALAGGEAMAAGTGISAATGMLTSAAVQQGADMGQEVYSRFSKVPQKFWDKNEQYQDLVKAGNEPEEAKKEIALNLSRLVAGTSGLLSFGVNKYMPGGQAIESKLTGKLTGATGLLKGMAGESVTEGIEEGGGKAIQNVGLQQVNPEQQISEDVGITTADAMGAGAVTAGTLHAPGAIADTLRAGKEVANDKLGNLADTDETKVSVTQSGRRTRFESDEVYKDVPEEAKAAWTHDIAKHAGEIWADDKLKEGTEYAKDNVKIFTDTVDKLAKLNNIESDEGKKHIEAELYKNLWDLTKEKNAEGNSWFNDERTNSLLSSVLNTFKGNKLVENEASRRYKEELESKFAEVRQRLAYEGVDTKDLSDKGLLTKEELENLEKTLANMRKLGSEPLTKLADDIQGTLEARQERLGSQETGTVNTRKNAAEVRKEIESIGFLTKGYKSLKDHANDLLSYVLNDNANKEDTQRTLDELETFTNSRQGKVNIFDRSGENTRVRSIGEIRSFAKTTFEDNEKILKLLNRAIAKTNNTDSKDRLAHMISSVNNTQGNLKEILDSKNTTEDDKALYKKLFEQGKVFKNDDKLLDKHLDQYVNDYTGKYDENETEFDISEDFMTQEEPVEVVPSNNVDENTEDGSSDTTEEISVEEVKPTEERKLSNDDVDFYKHLVDNAKQELGQLESVIHQYKELNKEIFQDKNPFKVREQNQQDIKKAKDIIKNIDETIWTHQKRIASLLADKSLTTKELGVLNRMLESYNNELTNLRNKASKVQEKLDKAEDEKTSIEQRMKYSYILIKEAKSLINKLLNQLKKLGEKIQLATTGKFAVEKSRQEVLRDLAYIEQEVRNLDRNIDSLSETKLAIQDEITDAEYNLEDVKKRVEERDNRLAVMGLDKEQIDITRDRIKSLRETISHYQELIDSANIFRNTITDTLGDIVKPNGSDAKSVTNRLFNGEDITDIMPRIVRNMENSEERISGAINALKQYERDRVQHNKTEGITKRFMTQSLEDSRAVLSRLGLDKLFSDEAITPMVEKAVNITSMLTLADMIDTRRLKGEQLDEFVEGAFGKLWSEDSETKDRDISKLKNEIRKGNLVPIATYASKAGRRLLEELEIKLDTKTAQDRMDVIQALGMIVVDNILANSQTKDSFKIRKTVAGMTEDGVHIKGEEDPVNVQMPIRVMMLDGLTDNQIKKVGDSAIIFEYAREHTDGMIGLTPTTFEYGKLGRNSDVPMSNSEIDYLNRQNSIEWKFSEDFTKMWETEFNKDLDALKKAMIGTKENLVKNTNVNEIESAIAKYDADDLDIERMMMAYEIANGNGFYINWDFTISNRSMMNNRMINPQNSKLSRFIVSAKDMRNNVDAPEKSISQRQKDLNNINLGFAQALDLDPDKFTDETVIEKLKKDYIDISLDNSGKYSVKVKNDKLKEVMRSKDTLTALNKVMGVSPEHIMHVYQGISLAQKIVNGEKLETNLALEVDGITNGMMSTVAQIGLNDRTAGYYIKCGTYLSGHDTLNGETIESHGQFKEKGGVDFYQTPAVKFVDELNTSRTMNEDPDAKESELYKVVNYLVTGNTQDTAKADKKWRSFLKPLVMVFAYGASMYNIGLKGSDDLAMGIVTKLKKPSDMVRAMDIFIKQGSVESALNKKNRKLANAIGIVQRELPKIERKSYDLKTGRFEKDSNGEYYLDDRLRNAMTLIINESIGSKLETAFNSEFAPITEYRKAIKAVNHINYLASKQAFKNTARDMFGTENYSKLTKEQERAVKDKLLAEGTYYGSYNTNGGMQDYFKTEQDANHSSETITVNLTQGMSKFYSGKIVNPSKINQIVKMITSNVGAVGVIDIHSIDGSTMIKGHIKDVLNIFDALVLGTDYETNNEQVKFINQMYYDILMNHSVLGTAVEKVAKKEIQQLLGQYMKEMNQADKEELINDLRRIFNINGISISIIQKEMSKVLNTLDEVDSSRRELVNTPAKIKQYYVGDSFEAAEWSPKELTGRYAVWNNEGNQDEKDMIHFMLTELIPAMAMEPVKEVAKVNDGILPPIQNEGVSPYSQAKLGELIEEIQC